MRKLSFITLVLLIYSSVALGQIQILWQQCYGGSEYEKAHDIVETDDGYLVIGSSPSDDGDVSYNHGEGDYWIVWIDSTGNLLNEKSFGGSSAEFLFDGFYAHNSSDIYLVGHSGSTDGDISSDPYSGETNIWVVRIDNEGNIIWDRKVGSPNGLAYHKLGIPTEDGGVVLAAQVDYPGGDVTTYYGGYDGWIIKLNSNGDTDWDFSIGSSEFEFINSVTQTSDGGFIAGLSGQPNGLDGNIDCKTFEYSPDAIAFRIDSNGNKVWSQCYGGSGIDGIDAILEIDDGYLLAGHGGSNDGDLEGSGWHGAGDVWILKTDPTGNIIWQKCYGGSDEDYPLDIFQTSEGDFIIFSNILSDNGDVIGNPCHSSYNPSIWVFKINNNGELLWQHCIGGINTTERVYGVLPLNENNYAIAAEMTISPSCDVNCSNYVWDSGSNYWAFEIKDITVNIM